MTMIASLHLNNVPIIVGDLLISDSIRPKEMILPTFSEDVLQYLSPASRRHPVKFNQKIYILKSNVCIAFAGSVFHFKSLLEDVRLFCKYHDIVTSQMMNDFLEGRHDETWTEFDCIIYVADKVENEYYLGVFKHGNWFKLETLLYGDVWSTGSGAADFLTTTSEAGTYSVIAPENPLAAAVKSIAMKICQILSEERITLKNVKKHWGAGFELVYFAGGQFRKLDNITYIINYSKLDHNNNGLIPLPAAVMNYKYHDDTLIITVVKPDEINIELENDTYHLRTTNIKCNQFYVVPIDSKQEVLTNEVYSDLNFKSFNKVLGYIIHQNEEIKIPTIFQEGEDFKIELDISAGLEISFKREITDVLRTKIIQSNS